MINWLNPSDDVVEAKRIGYQEGLAHLFLTYPNYGDGYKMVHDPLIGVNEQPIKLWVAVGIPVGIGLLLVGTIVTMVIVRKR